jgi:hypothetical protein
MFGIFCILDIPGIEAMLIEFGEVMVSIDATSKRATANNDSTFMVNPNLGNTFLLSMDSV